MALRTAFSFPARTPSWYAGHMARSMRELPALLDEVDLVLEARDARLPLTSINPMFDGILERVWGHAGAGLDRSGKQKKKIIVYTKRDLAEERYEAPLTHAFASQAEQQISFVDTRIDKDVRSLLRNAANLAEPDAVDFKILVVGMPNVGKSSLLNALRRVGVRKGKAFRTGAMPGVTRKLTGTVKVLLEPPTYVFDTPGVMVPFLGNGDLGAERGLKLALTTGIKDDLFEAENVADYLLWKLNLKMAVQPGRESYTDKLSLPSDFQRVDDLAAFLDALAHRIGALRRGGEKDLDAATVFFLKHFREGKLGRWTLDDVDGAEDRYLVAAKEDAAEVTEETQAGQDGPSDFGVVGDVLQTPPPVEVRSPSTQSKALPSLTSQVSATVADFLKQAAQEREDADAGRNLSVTQQKKSDLKAKADYRLAKLRAKGKIPSEGGGQGNSRGPKRGPKRARSK